MPDTGHNEEFRPIASQPPDNDDEAADAAASAPVPETRHPTGQHWVTPAERLLFGTAPTGPPPQDPIPDPRDREDRRETGERADAMRREALALLRELAAGNEHPPPEPGGNNSGGWKFTKRE